MMNCERAKELFSEYLEGGVDHAVAALVRSHLDLCPACAGELNALKQTWSMLDAMPQVEPPCDFRHSVVMQAARLQHQEAKSRQPGFVINWDAFLGRLAPARAIAIACLGAILAVLLLWVPPSAYEHVAGIFTPSATVLNPIETPRPANAIEASPLSMEAERKQEWQSRKLGRNMIWVSVSPRENGEGTMIYRVTLSVNESALLPDETSQRIGASVYVLPAGRFSVDEAKLSEPEWQGNVLVDSPVRVPVMLVDRAQGGPGSVNLLITWRFRQREFADIIIIPSKRSSRNDVFDLSVNADEFAPVGDDLYSTLQTIAKDYGVPVITNAYLDQNPSVVSFGKASLEEALIQTLKPIGLDWLAADRSVYVDRQYDVD
ncbi:MAG TPA: zf-HC2 domain-containing protein [Armatimonadota bacterium]|nr:zf-HC2 domain-containing protein [Armatimonadota bacterium]